jgi:hypothetical protein
MDRPSGGPARAIEWRVLLAGVDFVTDVLIASPVEGRPRTRPRARVSRPVARRAVLPVVAVCLCEFAGCWGAAWLGLGRGLRDADEERLFEPFDTTRTAGMRMALTIARSISEAPGGSIKALGHPGRGATFEVRLPSAGRAS